MAGRERELVHLPAVLAERFGISRSHARRIIAQGGAWVRLGDGEVECLTALDVPADNVARPLAIRREPPQWSNA